MLIDLHLAAAHNLDAHLARQHGRFDDAFLWSERAHAARNGYPVRFRGIDRRVPSINLEWLYWHSRKELIDDGCPWLAGQEIGPEPGREARTT